MGGLAETDGGCDAAQVKRYAACLADSNRSDSNGLGQPSEYIRHDIASNCVPSPYRTGRHCSGVAQLHQAPILQTTHCIKPAHPCREALILPASLAADKGHFSRSVHFLPVSIP